MERIGPLFIKFSGLIVYPLMALLTVLLLTPLLIRVLPRFGMVDHPGGRHIHAQETPRGGGAAVVFAVLAALFCFSFTMDLSGSGKFLHQFCPPALILAVWGIIDDRFGLHSLPKLAVQITVAVLVWCLRETDISLFQWVMPWYLSLPATVLWVLLVVNAFNLIDGLDGVACGLAVISSFSMAIWFFLRWGVSDNCIAMLILAGACLGFLPYNFHPAKIFLGDTGSTFIGLFFAVAGLNSIDKAATVTSLILPVLVIGVPVFDVFLAVWRRAVRKLLFSRVPGIMQGDRDHLHHRLFREMRNQSRTALMMYFLSVIFTLVALVLVLVQDTAPALGYLLMLLAFLVMLRRLTKIEQFDSFTLIRNNFSSPRKGLTLSMSHAVIDVLILLAASSLCSWLLADEIEPLFIGLFIGPPIAVLTLAKSYRVYWLRPGLRERLLLSWKVFIGTVLGALFVVFYLKSVPGAALPVSVRTLFMVSVIYVLSSTMLISFERFLLYYAESLWYNMFVCRCRPHKVIPVMICGCGISGRLYVRYLGCRNQENTVRPIGIFDEDPALHGMIVYGLPVYGDLDRLESVYQHHPFDRLIITLDPLPPEKRELLLDFSRRHQVRLEKFICHEQDF